MSLWDEHGDVGSALARGLAWVLGIVFGIVLVAAVASGDLSAVGGVLAFGAQVLITFVAPFALAGLACMLLLLAILRLTERRRSSRSPREQ